MKKNLFLLIVLLVSIFPIFSQPIYNEAGIRLYHTPSQEEMEWAKKAGVVVEPLMPVLPPSGEIRPIAEYEPMEAVLIRYPFGIPMHLIVEMAKDIKVITIVANATEKTEVLNQYNANQVYTANCEFLIANTDTYWTRDYGPWFMAIDNQEVNLFDFTYNRPRPNDNLINGVLATHLNITRYTSPLKLTGGNYMNDGSMQAASTTLTLTENATYTQQQIEEHFLEYLGIEQYHFIPDPIYPYDAIQHIDCWSKFLAPNKVLVTQVPTSNPNYNKFEAAANYFASKISSWGMPFEVYRVYEPAPTGTSQVTPYTNSLILNNKVFVPVAGNPNDANALQVYQEAMKGYEIIPIQSSGWLNTDALHCRAHEIADKEMLYIKHQPYFADKDNTGSIIFNAEIYSYGNHALYSDSVIVYIRVDGEDYSAYNMEKKGDNSWEVTISELSSGFVEYYLYASDESGRREHHPYIGKEDPHKFNLIDIPPIPPVLNLSKTYSYVYTEEIALIEDSIMVYNLGELVLSFEIPTVEFEDMLTVSPLKGTVDAGDSLKITLSYNFNMIGKKLDYIGSFFLLSNDSLQPETEITLKATLNLGIDKLNLPELIIYPNPAQNIIKVLYETETPLKASIVNVYGQQLAEITLYKGVNDINIQKLTNGIYFMKMAEKTYKFVKHCSH